LHVRHAALRIIAKVRDVGRICGQPQPAGKIDRWLVGSGGNTFGRTGDQRFQIGHGGQRSATLRPPGPSDEHRAPATSPAVSTFGRYTRRARHRFPGDHRFLTGVHAEESRGPSPEGRPWPQALNPLLLLLLAGLALRLVLAFLILPNSGFETDIATYSFWANRLHELGPGGFYDPGVFADYPPGYLTVMWLGGHVAAFLNGGTLPSADALKLGPIVADILVAFVLYRLVRSWTRSRPDHDRLALAAAALYLFNPVTWYDSAIWGQTDAVGALVVLLGVGALVRGNSEGAGALAVLAALVKPQFGVLLVPVVGAVLLRRHLISPGSGPRNRPWVPAAVRPWFERQHGPLRLVSSAVVGLVVLLAFITPFRLSVPDFIVFVARAAGGYEWLSVNAFNPWALIGAGGTEPLYRSGLVWSSDTVPLLGPLPGVVIGTLLLVAGFLAGMLRAAWRDDRRSIVVVAVFLGLAFFILPTRVHERYIFPVFALLPLLAVVDRRWLVALVVLSVATFINLHAVLTVPLYATPNLEHLPFGDLFREPQFIITSALLATGAFGFVFWQARRAAASQPDPWTAVEPAAEAADAIAPGTAPETAPETEPWSADGWAGETAGTAAIGAAPGAGRVLDRPRSAEMAAIRQSLTWLLHPPPLRRDRSERLLGEGGGRLDRIDALLVLVVFIVALGLRSYRLEEPYSMHFDEVYHPRTGMEFLQDWRYDMPHSIYEYTHPHLAKYLMAAGIELLGNNRVTSESELGTDVRDAALERRWSPSAAQGQRNGDWLYVVTPEGLTAYDLPTRNPMTTIAGDYSAVAVNELDHSVFVANEQGVIWRLSTADFDLHRHEPGTAVQPALMEFARLDGLGNRLDRLFVTGGRLVAVADDGTLASLVPATGVETGRTTSSGVTSIVGVAGGSRVIADPEQIGDQAGTATRLADLLDDDEASIRAQLAGPNTGRVVVAGFVEQDVVDDVQSAIDEGDLAGLSVEDGGALAINRGASIVLLDAETLDEVASFVTTAPVGGMALISEGTEKPTIYAAMGDQLQLLRLPPDESPQLAERVEMPAEVSEVLWNPATTYLHIVGRSQDGGTATIYVLEPRSNSVFADARLPFEPVAVLQDIQPERPANDRQQMLVFGDGGRLATVDTGDNAFAYRFPGVVAGAAMAACIYLLGRFLFRRRNVALIAALLVLADGMFFSNARIAMNDTYVSFFIVAALTLFVPLWLGLWRRRAQVAIGLLGVALLLGLALASKWVAAYAIGAVALLILLRSALGRLIALAAMIGLTAVLGYIAVVPATDAENPQVNFPFFGLMVALTIALAVGSAVRPVRWTRDELRLIVLGPAVVGGLLTVAGGAMELLGAPRALQQTVSAGQVMLVGVGSLALGAVAYVAAWICGRLGFGPMAPRLAPPPGVDEAAPPVDRGWMRPGSGPLGLSWLAALGAVTLIPLAVYTISFIPWIDLGNRWTADFPAGNSGQTFLDLQRSMYDYHNFLRATHAASSPWWAWPFDLKPVWFEQSGYANGATAVIYNTGNLVAFWLAIPAVAWVAFQAWRRRSLALGFLLIVILCLWLPWSRIDRVSFQYHIFTTLPFSFLALAYFLAELWNGPSRRTWLLARAAAALAIIGPPLLWLLRLPLCSAARTEQVNKGAEVCGTVSRQLELTDLMAVGVLLAIGGLVLAGVLLYLGLRSTDSLTGKRVLLLPAAFSIALAGMMTAIIGAGIPGRKVFEFPVRIEEPALLAFMLMLVPAYIALRARDARRFVVGALAAVVVWFVVFYPNFSGLPVPVALSQIHLGLLPTWNWSFQFGANLDASNRAGLDLIAIASLGAMVTLLAVSAVYSVRAWRADRAYRRTLTEPSEAPAADEPYEPAEPGEPAEAS
jgi:Gpi18-like mannosyltransferase